MIYPILHLPRNSHIAEPNPIEGSVLPLPVNSDNDVTLPYDGLPLPINSDLEETLPYETFETDIIKLGLVISISNFLLIKFLMQINGVRFSCSNSALIGNLYPAFHASEIFKRVIKCTG